MSVQNKNFVEKNKGLKSVAIIGLGCLWPGSLGVNPYWSAIKNLDDAILEVPKSHWKIEDYYDPDPKARDKTYGYKGAFLSPIAFEPLKFGIPPKDLSAIDSTQLLALVAAARALKDAGYEAEKHDHKRTAVILGVTGALKLVVSLGSRLAHPMIKKAMTESGLTKDDVEDVLDRFSDCFAPWQENSFPGLLGNVSAGRIANRLDLGGTNFVVDAACASSLGALRFAVEEIRSGRSDLVVTGGADTFNDPFMFTCFSKTPALSPSGQVRPYDADGDGTLLGEGLGLVVLKDYEKAIIDKDRIYAKILSIGASSDGKETAIFAPNPKGQARALKNAYDEAQIDPTSIELIEGHGTGTAVGDNVEVEALTSVFKNGQIKKPWCALGSIKAQIGHAKAAAGVAGLMKAVLALHYKVIPPTAKVRQPLPLLKEADSPFYLTDSPRPWLSKKNHKRRAGVSAFGFGGSNFHCLLEEHERQKTEVDFDGRTMIWALSSHDLSQLSENITKLSNKNSNISWAEAVIKGIDLNKKFNHQDKFRLILVVEEKEDWPEIFKAANSSLEKLIKGQVNIKWPESCFFGQDKAVGNLCFAYPGHGSQYPHMFQSLSALFPEMLTSLEKAQKIGAGVLSELNELGSLIYPVGYDNDPDSLTVSGPAQTSLAAMEMGLTELLRSFGVNAQFFLGHSFGELSAAFGAGYFNAEDFLSAAAHRGSLVSEAIKSGKAEGGMIAVMASLKESKNILQKANLELCSANLNSPKQTVYSGSFIAINEAKEIFKKANLKSNILKVDGAFHQPGLIPAAEKWALILKNMNLANKGEGTLYSSFLNKAFNDKDFDLATVLAGSLAGSVNFRGAVENLYQEKEVRTFVEVGPKKVLSSLIKQTLVGFEHQIITLDSKPGQKCDIFEFAKSLAQLGALGYLVDFKVWAPKIDYEKPDGFVVYLSGANYFEAPPAREPRIKNIIGQDVKSEARKVLKDPKSEIMQMWEGLIDLGQKTATLHQKFLDNQTDTLNLMKQMMVKVGLKENVVFEKETLIKPFFKVGDKELKFDPIVSINSNLKSEQIKNKELINYQELLFKIISKETGYPLEMLNKEMGLESDLGLDSIKKVEIMAAIAEEMPEVASISADDLNQAETISDLAKLLFGQNSFAVEPEKTLKTSKNARNSDLSSDNSLALLNIVSRETGYPLEMLNKEMGLESDLGLDSIKKVEIMAAIAEEMPEVASISADDLNQAETISDLAKLLFGQNSFAVEPEKTLKTSKNARNSDLSSDSSLALLNIVSRETGYPLEMLNKEMGLESDLGLDSIKKVEIMAAIAEEMPEVASISADDLNQAETISDLAKLLFGQNSFAVEPEKISKISKISENVKNSDLSSDNSLALLNIVSRETGYPLEMLNKEMGLESDLGLDSIKKVEIMAAIAEEMPEVASISADDLNQAETISDLAKLLFGQNSFAVEPEKISKISKISENVKNSDLSSDNSAEDKIKDKIDDLLLWELINLDNPNLPKLEENSFLGKHIFLYGLDKLNQALAAEIKKQGGQGQIIKTVDELLNNVDKKEMGQGLILSAEGQRDDGLATFQILKAALPWLEKKACLMALTFLDGNFALGENKVDFSPWGASLGGLVKTTRFEYPQLKTKVLDTPVLNEKEIEKWTETILAEFLIDDGFLEIARPDLKTRKVLEMKPYQIPKIKNQVPIIKSGEVLVATGAAKGVTAAAVLEIAKLYKPHLVIFGRTPLPPAEEPLWLKEALDEAQIKKVLLAKDSSMTPRILNERFKAVLSAREMLANLSAYEKAGASVSYYALDSRNENALKEALKEVKNTHGPIKGLIHGAGVLADSLISNKTLKQFENVYSTKVDSLSFLLKLLEDEPISLLVLFSSSSARFGRLGQADYAAANEVLNKMARLEARKRPEALVLSVAWGPWDGGMVNKSLAKIFKDEGLGLISLKKGAQTLAQLTLTASKKTVELVALGPQTDLKVLNLGA